MAERLRYADPATVLPVDRVHCDYFWIVDDGQVVGFLALRHRLNDFLLQEGGVLEDVRAGRRRYWIPSS